MVFHWSLSYRKSPQVSRTFLSILADHNSAVVWIVSTRPNTSNSFTKGKVTFLTLQTPLPSLWGLFQVNKLQLVSPSSSCSIVILVLWEGLSLSLSFRFLWLLLFYSLRVFHISVSRWSFPGVWATSHCKSPGLFSVFWAISTLLQFGLSPLILLFTSHPVFWWL